jgi:hypothetical protein
MAFIRLVVRIVGFLLLAAAFVVFVIDGTRAIAGGPLVAAPLGQVLAGLDPALGVTLVNGAWHAGAPSPWAPLAAGLLGAPAFAVLAIVGIVLMLLGRRRRRPFAEQAWRS